MLKRFKNFKKLKKENVSHKPMDRNESESKTSKLQNSINNH